MLHDRADISSLPCRLMIAHVYRIEESRVVMPKSHEPKHSSPKVSPITPPAVPSDQITAWLERVPEVAATLRAEPERDAAVAAVAPFTALSSAEQLALVIALGQIRGAAAVDALVVATALETLSTDRPAAKEARRSTIRLRSSGAQSDYVVPRPTLSLVPVTPAVAAPEFVAGWASRTRERSEVTLALLWSRPSQPGEVDPYVITLNFWEGHIHLDQHHEPITQRRFEREVLEPLRTQEHLSWAAITAGQARALIEEMQETQTWRGLTNADDYAEVEPIIQRRLFNDTIISDPSLNTNLTDVEVTDEEVIVNFWGAWAFGDYALVYDLLGAHHAIRERETREAFIALRRQWYDEAKPARFQLGAITPQTQEQSGALWLPGSVGASAGARKNFAFFWSLELQESPIAGQMPEMPLATLTHPDTSRHWYWQNIAVERDPRTNGWRIGRIRDEGANAQAQPLDQLLARSDELWAQAESLASPEQNLKEDAARDHALRIFSIAQESLSTGEVALMRLMLDRGLHERLRDRSRQIALWERSSAVIRRMLTRFQDHAPLLHELSATAFQQARALAEREDEAGFLRWLELATNVAREAVEIDHSAESLVVLAELLLSQDGVEEAEALLRESLALHPIVGAWLDLGDVLMQRQQYIEAVESFEQAQRLDPSTPQIRWRLARALELTDRKAEARLVYEDALVQDENDAMAHALLGNLLFEEDDLENAGRHLESALRLGLASTQLLVQLANVNARLGRFDAAKLLLTKAGELDPAVAQDTARLINQVKEEEARQKRGRR